MKCAICGQDNPEGAKFCRGCGAALSNERLCPKCGARNLPDSSFCSECGARLDLTAGTIPPTTPSPSMGREAAGEGTAPSPTAVGEGGGEGPSSRGPALPTSFVHGRYQVKRFLGEGGKKRVYLAH